MTALRSKSVGFSICSELTEFCFSVCLFILEVVRVVSNVIKSKKHLIPLLWSAIGSNHSLHFFTRSDVKPSSIEGRGGKRA